MNNIRCDCCGRRLQVPGAILLGPPHRQDGYVRKMHICVFCFEVVQKVVEDHEKVNLGDAQSVPEPSF